MITILDILKKELIGKKIELLKYELLYSDKEESQFRFFTENYEIKQKIKKDKRLKFIDLINANIIDVYGYSIEYEGNSLYILAEYENQKIDIYVNVIDELNIL